MKELETLLNQLLQMWWKPWGLDYFTEVLVSWTVVTFYTERWAISHTSLRDIVSLESKLWQFVCENKLHKKVNEKFRENVSKVWPNIWWFDHNYQYRLLESALIPEEELGKFLVDNIVINE